MANAFTDTSSAAWQKLVETAFDRAVEYQLRDEPQFRQIVDKRPVAQAMPGNPVILTLHNDLPLQTGPLTETVDPDAVAALPPTRVSVTPNEYGMATLETLKLRATAFTKPEDEMVMLLARNQADSLDALVRTVCDGGTNKASIEGAAGSQAIKTTVTVNNIIPADTLSASAVSAAVSFLRRRKVNPKVGQYFAAYVHPDVAYDLRREAAGNTWVDPHIHGGDSNPVYAGTIGTYAGATFVETTRVTTQMNAAATPNKVYNSYFFGQQALVELNVVEPHAVLGPQTDKLRRFYPLGWYGFLGWAIYRQEALQIFQTSSSLQGL